MKIRCIFLIPLLIALFACSKNFPDLNWDYDDEIVIGKQYSKLDSIELDIYIDATTSMEGFSVNSTTIYSQFLDLLEASALSAWRKSNITYYKFGSFVKPISRDEFLRAKNNYSFYRDNDRSPETGERVFTKTYIDKVVEKTNAEKLSILITDLFQDEGDVNIMVEHIKEKCFLRGVNIGIIAINSAFRGKVFDVPQYPSGYDLNTENRPFYAIIFGNPNNMNLLFSALKISPFVQEDKFLLISNSIIKNYSVSLVKTRDSKFVNKKAPRRTERNSFEFSMKAKGDNARFNLVIDYVPIEGASEFSAESIELFVNKKSISDFKKGIIYTENSNDIEIEKIIVADNKIVADLILKNKEVIGNYSYEIKLGIKHLSGLQVPTWINEYSTNNPVPNTPSASKTYNLDKFSRNLLQSHLSVESIYISKFYLHIYKR